MKKLPFDPDVATSLFDGDGCQPRMLTKNILLAILTQLQILNSEVMELREELRQSKETE